jgi:alpha-maltose-1-phosphate synthase
MAELKVININLSTSGSRLGGAAIAAEFLCHSMAPLFSTELWRMWDKDEEIQIDLLKIKNFASKTKFRVFDSISPRKGKAFFLDSDISQQVIGEKPDIIHLHNPIPSLAFEKLARSAKDAGIPVVATTHGFYEVMHPNYGLSKVEKILWKYGITKPVAKALKYLDGIFSLYPGEAKMLIDLGVKPERIHLTPNGVNPFFLQRATSEEKEQVTSKFSFSSDTPVILFMGNHTSNKGLDTVMRIASEITYPATFVIGGKLLSPDEPKQWDEKFSICHNAKVIFTDYLTIAEQRSLYQLADMLLFPSLADTLPLTIIEAMASYLPVIAYDVGGISFQLQDDCGVLVEAGQTSDFLAAVELLLTDSSLRQSIAHNAKKRQEEIFDWDKTALITANLYQRLIQSPSSEIY